MKKKLLIGIIVVLGIAAAVFFAYVNCGRPNGSLDILGMDGSEKES